MKINLLMKGLSMNLFTKKSTKFCIILFNIFSTEKLPRPNTDGFGSVRWIKNSTNLDTLLCTEPNLIKSPRIPTLNDNSGNDQKRSTIANYNDTSVIVFQQALLAIKVCYSISHIL